MKKIKKILIFTIVCSFIINAHYSIFATNFQEDILKVTEINTISKKNAQKLETDITSDKFLNDFDPEKMTTGDNSYKLSTPFVNTITNIVNPVLGIVQAIGGILTIISIAIFGFGMILSGNEGLAKDLGMNFGGVSGPEAKRKLLDFGRSLMIGSILMFSSATLVQFVFRVLKG